MIKLIQTPLYFSSFLILFHTAVIAQNAESDKNLEITGELRKWHPVTLTFKGPSTEENALDNPFLNYRLVVTFQQGGQVFRVPGYFAADGDAANTSAASGNKWRVHFSPPSVGVWRYQVSFQKGENVAVLEGNQVGESAAYMDGQQGQFRVLATDKVAPDFRSSGQLRYNGTHYLQFAESGAYFLKAGADAPENFLAYADFDGDFKSDGHKDQLVKKWEAHLQDWKQGDPSWQNGKGKAMIGALNYLASKGMNAFSFLTLNIKGDDQNVFPYLDYEDFTRIDVSRMDQWNIVFSHAQKLGLFLHFKTQEIENQGLLDGGKLGIQRKLYYRELIARFGHHLALNWNLGEENGDNFWAKDNPTPFQYTPERIAMADYFFDHDPYHHHLVIHNGVSFHDLLGEQSKITGPSIQTDQADFRHVHGEVLRWRSLSASSGRPWVITVDEPGDAQHSLLPDAENPQHDNARKNALWGTLMGGGAGIEWYFGYDHPHSDLNCEDWRSRDLMWDQSRYALDFFKKNNLPFWEMVPDDGLTSNREDYCLIKHGSIYIIYQKKAKAIKFPSGNAMGAYQVRWYNPRNGQFLAEKKVIQAAKFLEVEACPIDPQLDWVVLIEKVQNP